jgi:NADPH-dependent glutamate synthase beta subunit-like oxidoreductase
VSFVKEDSSLNDLSVTRWNTIDADPEILQASIPKIFTAGDSYTGASLVIEAIGGARRAARAIHLYLMEDEIKPVAKSLRKKHIAESLFDHVSGVNPKPRAKMPELPVDERIKSFKESDLVLSEKDALAEAERCLNCCRLCYDPEADAA